MNKKSHDNKLYDHDKSGTNSLGSTFIYKRFQNFEEYYDMPVAEYTGRPETAEDYYENVRKLLVYYNAKLLYENERKGIFVYFTNKHCDYLLADQPDIITDIIKQSGVSRRKGIHMTQQIKDYGEGLIKEWLNEEYAPGKKNLTKILSEPLLEELISYNDRGNFDRCCTLDTKVLTKSGYIELNDIIPGDMVVTHTGQYKEVTDKIIDKYSGELYEIAVRGDYRTVKCTDNHPILITYGTGPNGGRKHKYRTLCNNTKFVTANRLEKNHFVFMPKRINLSTTNYSKELLYFLGWYLSDGYASTERGQVRITLQYDQYNIALELQRIILKVFNKSARVYKIKDKNAFNVEFYSKKIADFIISQCGGPHKKLLSDKLYNCGNILPLLLGYFEGDGHQKKFAKYDGYRREVIELTSVSEQLILQIRQLLLDHDIWCSIEKKQRKETYNISIPRKYINKLVEGSLKFHKVPEVNLVDKSNVIHIDTGYWIPIKEIKHYHYTGDVCNLEVKDDHTYVSENFISHNCIALMMVMLYRLQLHNLHVKNVEDTTRKRILFDMPLFGGSDDNKSMFGDKVVLDNDDVPVYTFNR